MVGLIQKAVPPRVAGRVTDNVSTQVPGIWNRIAKEEGSRHENGLV
jgi:hypothetical protein